MTQKEMVLNHLKEYGKITDLDAYKNYAIRRLAATIFNLRADGVNIRTENTKEKNRFGQVTMFATYILEVKREDK